VSASGEEEAEVRERIARIYREDSRRILATLIRLLGDFNVAEEAMQDAFAVAVESWQGGAMRARFQ
jgi:RNA polymerase sigma-70 factor (ECF subfamily)